MQGNSKIKVLHVCWDLGQGGIQCYLIDLLRAHQKYLRSSVLVLSCPGALSQDAEALSEDVIYVGMKSGLSLLAIMRIFRFLVSVDYDIIHSHANNLILNLALGFQSKPVVYTEHGGRFLNKDFASLFLYKFLNRNIDSFIAISNYLAELMSIRSPDITERIRVIHNGVAFQSAEGGRLGNPVISQQLELPDGPKVGFVGRLVVDKGIDLFVASATKVCAVNSYVNFFIVGDGPAKKDMQDLVARHGLTHRIHFLGYRKDARQIISQLDILLFCSRYDAFGLVIVEALLAGVPVVAMVERSAVGEIVRDGVEGLLVEGLNVDAAAECVSKLLNDDAVLTRMKASAKERGQLFTIEKNALEVYREYTRCIQKSISR